MCGLNCDVKFRSVCRRVYDKVSSQHRISEATGVGLTVTKDTLVGLYVYFHDYTRVLKSTRSIGAVDVNATHCLDVVTCDAIDSFACDSASNCFRHVNTGVENVARANQITATARSVTASVPSSQQRLPALSSSDADGV